MTKRSHTPLPASPRIGSSGSSCSYVDATVVLVIVLAIFGGACGDGDLEIRYQYDGFGLVKSATVRRGDSVVAVAERIGISPAGGPTVTDIQVEEVHFGRTTQDVLYKGRMVFRCKTNQEFCDRTSVTPVQGMRPRDAFRRWPYATMGIR